MSQLALNLRLRRTIDLGTARFVTAQRMCGRPQRRLHVCHCPAARRVGRCWRQVSILDATDAEWRAFFSTRDAEFGVSEVTQNSKAWIGMCDRRYNLSGAGNGRQILTMLQLRGEHLMANAPVDRREK